MVAVFSIDRNSIGCYDFVRIKLWTFLPPLLKLRVFCSLLRFLSLSHFPTESSQRSKLSYIIGWNKFSVGFLFWLLFTLNIPNNLATLIASKEPSSRSNLNILMRTTSYFLALFLCIRSQKSEIRSLSPIIKRNWKSSGRESNPDRLGGRPDS